MVSEFADYLEFQTFVNGSISVASASSAITMPEDNEVDTFEDSEEVGLVSAEMERSPETIFDIEDLNYNSFDDVFGEIENRRRKANGNYPFRVNMMEVSRRDDIEPYISDIYLFLLLVTRMSMGGPRQQKIQAGLDGTALFERLCAFVLKNFFGEHSESLVFGTGAERKLGFEEMVKYLISKLKEPGVDFNWPYNSQHAEKDGKVDIVLFIPFQDGQQGRFMAFGQCKTGQSWRPAVSQLNPPVFNKLYFKPTLTFDPIAVFMVSESFFEDWEIYQRSSNGFLMDRSRIMQFIPNDMEKDEQKKILLSEIRSWNASALKSLLA